MRYLSAGSKRIIHARANDAVKFTSRDILNKFIQLKYFIKAKSPDAEITISTPTLRSGNGETTLKVKRLINLLISLWIDISI